MLFAFFILIIISGIGAANEITISPGTSTIQPAVNSASSGDVIILNPGNYYDNVNITKENLTIKSYSGNPDDTWVRAYNNRADAFHVQADKTNIYGLKISGAVGTRCSAINLSWCRFCSVKNNKLESNLRGVNLLFAHWSVISGNTVTSNNEYGIDLQNATANVFSENKVHSNVRGIYFGNSDGNSLSGSTIQNNGEFGFSICGRSDMNTVYNNYFNDTYIYIKNGVGNSYNSTKAAGTNIMGGPYIGGNYWGKPDGTGFSQKAVDNDRDGISDSVYTNINGSIYSDYLPLVIPGKVTPILPVANFTSNVSSGNSPLTVLFTSTSTNATNVSWNFGDGTSAVKGTQVSHTFNNTGTSAQIFTVTLTAANTNGTSNKTGNITVNPAALVKPVASFTVSPASGGTTATKYTFNDTSTNSPTSWSWDFGDGTTGSGKNVTHQFSAAKTYNVTLTAGNTAGSSIANKSVVVGTAAVKPVASFSVSPASGGTTATTYSFNDTSTNSPTSWNWNFGDGSTGSGKNVTHKYSTAKTYSVTLTAGNAAGNSTANKSVVVGTAAVKPVASFSVSPASGGTTATIYKFNDTSTNSPTGWSWDFGDGTKGSGKNVTHQYSAAKTYSVTLTAGNTAGNSTANKSVVVGTATVKPTASFTMSPTSGISTSTSCTFKSTSKNASTLTWNFGDGGTASGANVTRKFIKAGTLTVTLTASNNAGSSTASKTVSVAAVRPVAAFSYSPTTLRHGTTITFTDTSSNIPTKWLWTFSDTTSKPTTKTTTHVFSKAGTYKVTLSVYNSAGSNYVTKTLTVL